MDYDIFLTHLGRRDVLEKFDNLKSLINRDDPVIIEVGAHYGEDTYRFSKTFKNSSIYCFEPDPRNIFVFKKYFDIKNVKGVYQYAVSDKNEKGVDFNLSFVEKGDYSQDFLKYYRIDKDIYKYLQLSSSGSSSLKNSKKYSYKKVKVDCVTLNDWAKKEGVSNVDLLWIDVQGAEREVFTGAIDLLTTTKFVFVEYGELEYEGAMDKQQTIELMRECGFSLLQDNKELKGDLIFKNKQNN